jgi:hypothetical protein
MRLKLIFILLIALNSKAQTHFLKDYCGKYKGILILDYPSGKLEIPFQIEIESTKDPLIFTNRTSYFINDSTTDVKDYALKLDTTFKDGKHYILDEKDGILISETAVGNSFFSFYSVLGDYYYVKTSYTKKYIDFELTVFSGTRELKSSSIPDEEGVFYDVSSFEFVTCQHGKLRKVKK